MSRPAPQLLEHFNHPRNAGIVEEASSSGHADLDGSPPHVEVTIRIERGTIAEVAFQARGCGYLIAACSAATELVKHQPLSRCADLCPDEIVSLLGDFPPHKRHLVDLAALAVRRAAEGAPQA